MDTLENRVVTKSNVLVRSKYHLKLVELRLLLCVIAQLNPKEKLDSTKEYFIHAQHYAEMFGVDSENIYTNLREAIDTLYNRTIRIQTEGNKEVEFRWIQSKSYIDKKGMVSIMLTHNILPYLSELQSHFTQYSLNEIRQLDTAYSVRLYELAKSYLSLRAWSLTLDEFREIFELGNTYRQDNIQNRIIKPSIDLINKNTSLQINYEPYKVGRSVAGFRFDIREKKKTVTGDVSQQKNLPVKASYNWGMSDNTMFREIIKHNPKLTTADIEAQAAEKNVDLSSILHALMLDLKNPN